MQRRQGWNQTPTASQISQKCTGGKHRGMWGRSSRRKRKAMTVRRERRVSPPEAREFRLQSPLPCPALQREPAAQLEPARCLWPSLFLCGTDGVVLVVYPLWLALFSVSDFRPCSYSTFHLLWRAVCFAERGGVTCPFSVHRYTPSLVQYDRPTEINFGSFTFIVSMQEFLHKSHFNFDLASLQSAARQK